MTKLPLLGRHIPYRQLKKIKSKAELQAAAQKAEAVQAAEKQAVAAQEVARKVAEAQAAAQKLADAWHLHRGSRRCVENQLR